MAIPETEIPLERPRLASRVDRRLRSDAESGPATGLETRAIWHSRRAEPRSMATAGSRPGSPAISTSTSRPNRLLLQCGIGSSIALPTLDEAREEAGPGRGRDGISEWAHFRIAYRRGITVVRLVDPALPRKLRSASSARPDRPRRGGEPSGPAQFPGRRTAGELGRPGRG